MTPPLGIEISGIEIYEEPSFLVIAARIGNAGFEFKTNETGRKLEKDP